MNQIFQMRPAGKDSTAISLALEVTARRTVGEGIEEFRLQRVGGASLPSWRPGAHVELILPLGDGSQGRCYSLLGDPEDATEWRIAVLKQTGGRGGSVWMHDNALSGVVLPAVGPRHAFSLQDAEGYLFVAGGIGITPLLPMIAAVAKSGKPWELIYLARHESRFAYADALRAYQTGHVLFHVATEQIFDLGVGTRTVPSDTLRSNGA
ncbi:ferredoxin reductase (plasmid) [Mesorhizobium sp. AR02]|uniref:ferredoxin reductase n=1 Tax=Mesorhizobium sp. AR02 TaxID=2865837 RepID=UPI002160DDCF|nr:ferredoxin reductase [Mesorhizobium sp. AR02]UVK57325.1 ferredoxin reductase [Mesorhizobium sp. AR02]